MTATTPIEATPAPTNGKRSHRRQQPSRFEWVPLSRMQVHAEAQRKFQPAWAQRLAANFDPDALGVPECNLRDGVYWLIDGQHRKAAMEIVGWGDQQIQCKVYLNLSDEEMARRFLGTNNQKAVHTFDRFRVAVAAGRPEESDIERVIRTQGLKVSERVTDRTVSAVEACRKVYRLGGPGLLGRVLRIIRDAYAGDGQSFNKDMIVGLGLVCQRYGDLVDETEAAAKLGAAAGSVSGLRRKAQSLKLQTGRPITQCVAAAAVEILDSGRAGRDARRLGSWWK